MGRFTETSSHATALSSVKVASGYSMRLHLVDVKARVAEDISITAAPANIVEISLASAPYDGPNGIWTVDFKGKTAAKTKVTAKHKDAEVATLDIEVFTPVKIVLDGKGTEAGMLQRLLLAESIAPSD